MKTTPESKSNGTAKKTTQNNSTYSGDDKQLLELKPIEGTPFQAVKHDKQWFLAFGKYKISDHFDTLNQCIQDSKSTDWFRVLQIIQIMIEEYHDATHKHKEPQQQEPQQPTTTTNN